jgi:hypothetical protein
MYYIGNTHVHDVLAEFLIAHGYDSANEEALGYASKLCTKYDPSKQSKYVMTYDDDDTVVRIPDKPVAEGKNVYRGFMFAPGVDRKASKAMIDRFYSEALAEPVGKIITSNEHSLKRAADTWGYDKCQLGKELLDRARNKKYKDWFDAWNDNSQENYNHIVELATNLIGYLRCKETVEGNVYSYSYKDSVFFRVDLDEGMVDFPVCNAVIKEIADEKHMDNPLLGFACGFMTVDRYIYGPAQGMYNMFYAFSRGYMVSQYPETREWIKVK